MQIFTLMDIQNFTKEDEDILRENLKRCSPETIEAAVAFRKTGDVGKIGDIILGIVARFVEPENKAKLENPSDDMVLAQELGLDSITMVEIIVSVEDALGTTIDNSEIQNLRTLGDIKGFIQKKLSA